MKSENKIFFHAMKAVNGPEQNVKEKSIRTAGKWAANKLPRAHWDKFHAKTNQAECFLLLLVMLLRFSLYCFCFQRALTFENANTKWRPQKHHSASCWAALTLAIAVGNKRRRRHKEFSAKLALTYSASKGNVRKWNSPQKWRTANKRSRAMKISAEATTNGTYECST